MNKSKLKLKAKDILNKYPVGTIVSNLEEVDFLLSIFQNHPEWLIKKGCGIEFISTIKTQTHGTRCFVLYRKDGSTTDISYIQSISPVDKYFDIKVACRTSIRDIVIDFRRKNFITSETVCPISDVLLTYDNVHVDHYDLTFNELYLNWIENNDKDLLLQSISNVSKDNETDVYFTNLDIKNNFIEFHNANTNLRIVSKFANLSYLKLKS